MSDPFPPVSTTTGIPGQRTPLDHPLRPDLPQQRTAPPYDAAADTARPLTPAGVRAAEAYAPWRLRVGAVVVDSLLQVPFLIAEVVGLLIAFDGGGLTWVHHAGLGTLNDTYRLTTAQMTANTWIGLAVANLAGLALVVFTIWNSIFRQGRKGASLGKQAMNLVVVSEHDGRPIGALFTLIRNWAHLVDLLLLGLGYLWPLWDRKRQTFADMIMQTAVLHLPPQETRSNQVQMTPMYDW